MKSVLRGKVRFDAEIIGEFTLLVLVGAYFVYIFLSSQTWDVLGAQLMPWIALSIGLPFWLIRFVIVVKSMIAIRPTESRGVRSD